ncbi:MAG: c-type cytochrome [Rhodocyclaceae bacterium]|nr:c-type cytochrome [Rhodocyclaceae bacterium]
MGYANIILSLTCKRARAAFLLAPFILLPVSLLAADAQDTVTTICATCHGADGNSTDPVNPKLAGMGQEYLLRQLNAFASGKRRDEIMSAIIASIDSNDFPKLAAYYGPKQPSPGKVQNQQLAAKGRPLYEDGNTDSGVPACAGCHQSDGRGNARFPRLAGQHQAYTVKQLNDYKSGRRATDPLMTTVGKRLTADEIKAVAEYIAGL